MSASASDPRKPLPAGDEEADGARQMANIPFLSKKIKRRDIQITLIFFALSFMLVFAGVSAYNWFIKTPPYVDPERYPVRGIDVSAHNGMMSFDGAKEAGIEFVFIKATEGTDFRDTNFRLNYDKARKAGLKIGAYHFFRFDADGVSQAINLLKTIGDRQLELGIAVDVEQTGNPKDVPLPLIKEQLGAMIDYLNLRGYRVTLYSNKDGYYDYIRDDFRGLPLWICGFTETPINEDWTFWQYYHHGKVKGINGEVDLNAFGGSREEWEEFLRDSGVAPGRQRRHLR